MVSAVAILIMASWCLTEYNTIKKHAPAWKTSIFLYSNVSLLILAVATLFHRGSPHVLKGGRKVGSMIQSSRWWSKSTETPASVELTDIKK